VCRLLACVHYLNVLHRQQLTKGMPDTAGPAGSSLFECHECTAAYMSCHVLLLASLATC